MRKLDLDLQDIKERLLILSACVKQSYLDMAQVITKDDYELALEIIKNDTVINEMEDSINQKVIQIIALQAPVATDLRMLISALKIANQLERIADYVVNIADYVLVFADESEPKLQEMLLSMINYVTSMLDATIKVMEKPELRQIEKVAKMDHELDDLYDEVSELLLDNEADDAMTKYHLRTILIAKYLERSGDHITNILESIAYLLDGNVYNFNTGSVKRQYLKKR